MTKSNYEASGDLEFITQVDLTVKAVLQANNNLPPMLPMLTGHYAICITNLTRAGIG